MEKEKITHKTGFGQSTGLERPEVSIIIPCFNEEDGIVQTVEAVCSHCQTQLSDYSFEIVLVDDGSKDKTVEKLHALSRAHGNITVVCQPVNRGRGAALKLGLKSSKGDYVITLDADLSYDVEHITSILKAFEQAPSTDAVLISPYMKGGYVQGVPLFRLFVSRMANWILSGFFDNELSTVTCVARGYRGDIIRSLPLFENNKEFHLEVLRKLAICGATILEIPGRLVWKEKKKRAARKGGVKVFSAAKKHLVYAFLIRPTRLFKWMAILLFVGSIYEFVMIAVSFGRFYEPQRFNFVYGVWLALYKSFWSSPHSYFIASLSLILSVQFFFYLAILKVLKLQQEETLRHLIAVLQPKLPGEFNGSRPEFNN